MCVLSIDMYIVCYFPPAQKVHCNLQVFLHVRATSFWWAHPNEDDLLQSASTLCDALHVNEYIRVELLPSLNLQQEHWGFVLFSKPWWRRPYWRANCIRPVWRVALQYGHHRHGVAIWYDWTCKNSIGSAKLSFYLPYIIIAKLWPIAILHVSNSQTV